MTSSINQLIYCLVIFGINLFYIKTLNVYIDTFFANKDQKNSMIFKVISIITVILSTFSYFNAYFNSVIITILITACFIFTYRYKTTILNRIVVTVIIIVLYALYEKIIFILIHIFSSDTLANINPYNITIIILYIIYKLFPYLIIKVYQIYRLKYNKTTLSLTKFNTVNSITIIFLMCLIFISTYYLTNLIVSATNKEKILIIIFIFSFVLLFFILFEKYNDSVHYTELKYKEIILKKDLNNNLLKYNELKNNIDDLSKIKHNLKHKLLAVLVNSINDFDTLIENYNQLFDEAFEFGFEYYTNNHLLDLILNQQINRAKLYNINVKLVIDSPLKFNISNDILAVVLGNLIENSIEACIKHNKDEIIIKIKMQNENLYLQIVNKYDGVLYLENGIPISTKKDNNNHGIGLKSIVELLNKDLGIIDINTENNIYDVKIIFIN